MTSEKLIKAKSGWAMLVITVLVFAASCAGLVWSIMLLATADDAGLPEPPYAGPMMLAGFLLLALGFCPKLWVYRPPAGRGEGLPSLWQLHWHHPRVGLLLGEPFLQPQDERVRPDEEITEEGGKKEPLAVKAATGISTKVSLRAHANGERIKVNDKRATPSRLLRLWCGACPTPPRPSLTWDSYISYVAMQTETALRHVASIYAYDHAGRRRGQYQHHAALQHRGGLEQPEGAGLRLAPAGVEVDDARLYAPCLRARDCARDASPPAG